MALATSIVEADGIVTSYSKGTRNLRDAGESFYNLVESNESEVQVWVALTYAAAQAAAVAEPTTGAQYMTVTGTDATYQGSISEDVRVVGSYTYQCSAEKKSIAFAEA